MDGGGKTVYLTHLLRDVGPCEGGPDWSVRDYHNGYTSRFQFSYGSWATASRATGFTDGTDPYQVGRNVAWWINAIADPGSTDGWPTCWHT